MQCAYEFKTPNRVDEARQYAPVLCKLQDFKFIKGSSGMIQGRLPGTFRRFLTRGNPNLYPFRTPNPTLWFIPHFSLQGSPSSSSFRSYITRYYILYLKELQSIVYTYSFLTLRWGNPRLVRFDLTFAVQGWGDAGIPWVQGLRGVKGLGFRGSWFRVLGFLGLQGFRVFGFQG